MGSVAALIADARTAGLTVVSDDGRLVVRGPREAERLALALLSCKEEVLAAIANEADQRSRVLAFRRAVADNPDVTRRANAMRSRHEVRGRVVQFLTVVDVPREAEGCRSCGEPLQPLRDGLVARCEACALAARLVLTENG